MPKRSTKKPAPDRKRLTRSIADSAHASAVEEDPAVVRATPGHDATYREPDVAPEPPRKKPAAKKRR